MRYRRIAILAPFFLTLAFAAKKKSSDEHTQSLDFPKDPPMVASGDTSRLVFHVSPLSAKGLLSQQTREAIKSILKSTGNAPIIHIRAFVAGSGDLRRVPEIVSEVLSQKKMPLPSVSAVQVGSLALEGAQIVLETVSMGRKEVNPDGLLFAGGQRADSLAKSVGRLVSRLGASAPLRITCFVSDAGDASAIASRFPSAAIDVVQAQRSPSQPGAECEAIARGGSTAASKIAFTRKIAFTGTQVAFGTDEKAAALAFERLDRDLRNAGVDPSDLIETHIYPISPGFGEMAVKVRQSKGPATLIPVEGVASIDGSFAIDAIALWKQ